MRKVPPRQLRLPSPAATTTSDADASAQKEKKGKKAKKKKKAAAVSDSPRPKPKGIPNSRTAATPGELQLFVPFNEGLIARFGVIMGKNWFPGGKIVIPSQIPPHNTNPENKKGEKALGGPKGRDQTPHLFCLCPSPAPLFPVRENPCPVPPVYLNELPPNTAAGRKKGGLLGICGGPIPSPPLSPPLPLL
eukprot:FR735337.1.p3 GENE.FR735337.1~~FR735337.1.p3  ORF type:complete len:191 (+),score=67.49 FR735337.1:655-1227(+)